MTLPEAQEREVAMLHDLAYATGDVDPGGARGVPPAQVPAGGDSFLARPPAEE